MAVETQTGFTTFADIVNAIATLFKDRVIATWNRACPEMAFLRAMPATGKNVSWTVKFGSNNPAQGASGGKFTDGAPVTAVRKEKRVAATLQFANYHEAFGLTGKDRAATKVTNNPLQMANQYGDELKDATGRLARMLMASFYNGDGSTDEIHGMYATAAPAIGDVGVYAGIDPAVDTAWKGNVVDALGASISFALLRQLRRSIVNVTGQPPDLYICDAALFDEIASLYDSNRRWVDEVTRTDGSKVKVDGAVEVMTWQGARILWSPNHPPQKLTALNTSEIHVEQLPDGPDGINQAAAMIPLQSPPEEQEGEMTWPLQALIQPLAIQGNAYNFDLQMYPSLVVDKRNAHGYLANLQASP